MMAAMGQGTPSRDRDRLPFPKSSHPSPAPSSRQTASSSTSTNLSLSSSSPTMSTVEALLKDHASAPDPTSAALEHAVSDRNVLAAQNTQLWKLVEKQRTGYNQILKELERIRGDRDVYKNRLITLNGGQSTTSDKRHRNTTAKTVPPPSLKPPQRQKLSVTVEDRPQLLSRDSRISLPEEAKHYIANMSDSSLPSPRTDVLSSKSKLSASVFPSPPSGRESEFLEMDDEDDEDNDEQSEDDDATTEDLALGNNPIIRDEEDRTNVVTYVPSQPLESQIALSSRTVGENADAGRRRDKARVAAEEFPLPPASNPLIQRQALAAQEAQLHAQGPQHQTPLQEQKIQLLSPGKQVQVTADQPRGYTNLAHPRSEESVLLPRQTMTDQPGGYTNLAHPRSEENIPLPRQTMADQPGGYTNLAHPRSEENIPLPRQAMADQPGEYKHLAHPRSEENISIPQQNRRDSRLQSSQDQQLPETIAFRALPLLSSDLPHTNITVSHSFVRPNDRGKEVLSFIVFVDPGSGKDGWKVEKMYSDVLGLDQRVRSSVAKGVGKKIANLPEGKLWKDHAPAKVDQRKAVLENYLQTLIQLPVKNNDEVIAFFTSDIVRDLKQPVMRAGHKEGYLTKRGKNFGGWKTRFFVLQGPVLEYYDCRGGAQLGSIVITGAQIARQHRTERPPTSDDEKEYRHAFLIVEAKKGPGGNHPRHVLCAESDEDRDSWVEMLVRYYTGTYSEELMFNPSSGLTSIQNNTLAVSSQQSGTIGQPRSSTSSNDVSNLSASRVKASVVSREDPKGAVQLPADAANAKLYALEDHTRSSSPSKSAESLSTDRQGALLGGGQDSLMRGLGLPSSLPDSSPLSSTPVFQPDVNSAGQRANSELGHYSDSNQRHNSPDWHRNRDAHDGRKIFYSSLGTVAPSPTIVPLPAPSDRVPSPEKLDSKVKISGPMNGAPIPSGFKFGGSSSDAAAASNDRREKAKSRSFWGFGKPTGDKLPHTTHVPRAVFGVPLEEALDVAQMCNLPAIVFRSIQYLEAKKADQEEGIYRLSGSSAVIKNLKDRFNSEGDVDLLASDEYWDPHAIAGLLKSFLRELPASILTRELHLRFLAVIDFVDAQERIRELSYLIAALPLANYSLLRALTAHLILIVQNSNTNKMTMRNVGIVFSPTLGIPAGVFSLMLGEFNRVFNVDADNDVGGQEDNNGSLLEEEPMRRNSRQYSDAAADQLLGLSGRSLSTPAEETQSEYDDYSMQEESGPEMTEEVSVDSYSSSSPTSALAHQDYGFRVTSPDEPLNTPTADGAKASDLIASGGLKVSVTHSDRGNRHSKMMGLPSSPRLAITPLQSADTPSPTRLRPND